MYISIHLAENQTSFNFSTTYLKQPRLKRPQTNYRLMQVRSIAECPKGSIL